MKLAFALFTYFPYGGLTRDLIAIAHACQQRGHQVRVYTGEDRTPNQLQSDSAAELDVQLVPVKAITNHTKNRKFAAQLQHAVAQFSPDIVVGFNKMPGIDMYYAADSCFAEKSSQRAWWYRITARCRHHLAFEKAVFAKQSSTEILMLANRTMNLYQQFYDTPQQRMTLLPPGISRDRIAGNDAPMRRIAFRKQWQIGEDEILLLAVGSGFRTKGLERTLQALASLPAHLLNKTTLFVVGDDKTAPYEKLARRLDIDSKVKFLGGRDDVPEFLVGADLLVHPAHRENTGTVLLEAMVAGLPVLATDVCGYAQYIRDANMGEVLATPFAQSELNDRMLRLLGMDRDSWRKLGHDFAQKSDIYDMPLHACKQIEAIAAQKSAR